MSLKSNSNFGWFLNLSPKFLKHISQKMKKSVTQNQRPLESKEGDLGFLESLPREIIRYLLFSFFHPREIYPLFLVSRKMYYYANDEFIWNKYYLQHCHNDVITLPQSFTTWKNFVILSIFWKWDPKKKADVIELDNNLHTAFRPQNLGSNPAVLASNPLTSKRDSFEIQVISRGNWIGIGFCDTKFILHNGQTLGTQLDSLNCSLFCQDSTSIRISCNKDKILLSEKIGVGDRIKVKIDFNFNEVHFYRNGILQGTLHSNNPLCEGQLYPCVNLSHKTMVTFITEY